jgi:hypothetical protein
MEPSRPLWPAQWTYNKLLESPRTARFAAKLDSYFRIPERAHAGEALVQAIPASERQVLVLEGDDWPLLPLFRPYSLGRDVLLIPLHSTSKKLDELGVNYVIVGGGGAEYYPELCRYLDSEGSAFQAVMTRDYVSRVSRGGEPWTLYRRIGSPKSLPN